MAQPDFAKGSTAPPVPYDTSPAGLGLNPAWLGGAVANASSVSGSQTIIVSEEVSSDTTTTSTSMTDLVSFSAADFANDEHYLEIAIPNLRNSSAGSSVSFQLSEAAVAVTNSAQIDVSAADTGVCVFLRVSFTPTSGSHTYTVQWKVSAGTGKIRTTGLCPANFRVVKA